MDFTGTIPQHYESDLGPVLFEPYARVMAERVLTARPARILEIAAGTGRLTRHLAEGAAVVATDYSADMMAKGQALLPSVEWRQADAHQLPFDDASFDAVACQFGVMFFEDKVRAFREMKRVLREGGKLTFAVWASQESNRWSRIVHETMLRLFPEETPGFMAIPFRYCDEAQIRTDLTEAGWKDIEIERVDLPLEAREAKSLARGFIIGNPLALALRDKGVNDFEPYIDAVAEQFRNEFGDHPMRSEMKALIVSASAA